MPHFFVHGGPCRKIDEQCIYETIESDSNALAIYLDAIIVGGTGVGAFVDSNLVAQPR